MVRRFYLYKADPEYAKSEQAIAQLTGLLAASQSIARFLASYAWGVAVDKIGRKVYLYKSISATIQVQELTGKSHKIPYSMIQSTRRFSALNITMCLPLSML